MIRAVQELHAWLSRNGLNPADFKIVLYSDSKSARWAADVLGREADSLSFRPSGHPASKGQICGVPFSIVPFPLEPIEAGSSPRMAAPSSRLKEVALESIQRIALTVHDL